MSQLARALIRCALAASCGLLASLACAGPEDDEGENAGQSCAVVDDCWFDLDADLRAQIEDIQCLDRVPGGYCTHLCVTDADCCAVEGECETGFPQVCSPFESTGLMMCFLSCESEDIGDEDEEGFCEEFAHEAFGCRSSGGGSDNRKVCVP